MGSQGFCDLPIIQEAVEAQDDGLRQLKAQFAGKPSGTAYLMQKHYEELVLRESTLRLAVHITSISSRLSAVAQETKFNPPAQESSSRQMVLNASLLIHKSAFSSLENKSTPCARNTCLAVLHLNWWDHFRPIASAHCR